MKDISIALDFGASTTKMCVTKLGFILNEPSFVYEDEMLFGFEAKQKESEFLPVTSIMNNGKVINSSAFKELVNYMFNKCNIKGLIRNIYVSIPNAIEISELNKIEQCLNECGAIKVIFVNQAQLAYGVLNQDNSYRIIVDIGASKTDISIVKNNSVFSGLNLSIGSNDIDKQLKDYCYNTFSIDITNDMAEKIRTNIATLNKNVNLTYNFYGLSINGNKFAKNNIQSHEIYDTIYSLYSDICSAIETLLNTSDETIIEDVVNNGIDIIGGGALISGLSEFINNKINLKCNIQKNAATIIAYGLEKLI